MMQPVAAGYDLNATKFPRVYDWMERVKKETQPHFDNAHVVVAQVRKHAKKEEKSKL